MRLPALAVLCIALPITLATLSTATDPAPRQLHARDFLAVPVRRLAAAPSNPEVATPAAKESPAEAAAPQPVVVSPAEQAGRDATEAARLASGAANGTAASPSTVFGEGQARPAAEEPAEPAGEGQKSEQPVAADLAQSAGGAGGPTILGVSALTLNAGGDVELAGMFGSVNFVEGGFKKQDLLYPGNAAGKLEVEYNGTAANRILVAPKMATVPPPAGLVYVDPMTFTITIETAPTPGDQLKVDYIFTASVKAASNVALGTIGRLDPATNQFVTTGLGEFEFEAEENEWSLKVENLNGEWAAFIPSGGPAPAVEQPAAGVPAAGGEAEPAGASTAAEGAKSAGEKSAQPAVPAGGEA